jgi:glycosyltransferase involved in cell wall biosynthesis
VKDQSNTEPLVSVVIAAYNCGRFLSDAVNSVLKQTYRNLEILLVDDGSTDTTQEVIAGFSDPRLRSFYQANQGQAAAKNKGITEANGEFIAFLDADDLWHSKKLEMQIPLFSRSREIGVVYTKLSLIDQRGNPINTPDRVHHSGYITEKLLFDNCVTGMTSIIRHECIDKVGLFNENLPMGIDYDLWLRISLEYQFYFFDAITYYYRQWEGQMSHNSAKRMECAFQIMDSFFASNPGRIEQSVINRAYAHTYVTRGMATYSKSGNSLYALKDYLKALTLHCYDKRAWKEIIKLLLPLRRYKYSKEI